MSTRQARSKTNAALKARLEQAESIHHLGILSGDGWVPASSLGVEQRWAFYRHTSAVAFPVRNKIDRMCAKGMILKTLPIFDRKSTQDQLLQYWSRGVTQDFFSRVYELCLVIGWTCATWVPHPQYGAQLVVVPPWTPGLQLRWNQVGEVQARLSGDLLTESSGITSVGAQGIISRVFGPALGAAGVVTTTGTAGPGFFALNDPGSTDNSFDPARVPEQFFFSPPTELVFISLKPWDTLLRGVPTPMDSIMKNILFWDVTRELWLAALAERVNRPNYIGKPIAQAKKDDGLTDEDMTRADMPECKDGMRAELGMINTASASAAWQDERHGADQRSRSAAVAELWCTMRNRYGADPRAVLPQSLGGQAQSIGRPVSNRERRLREGEVLQKGDNPPDLPDISQLEAHLNEQAAQAYGVPLSLGSRSSDSANAKLWSTGGDEQAFRMYQQSVAADCTQFQYIGKKLFVKAFGPNYVVSSALRRMFEKQQEKAKQDQFRQTTGGSNEHDKKTKIDLPVESRDLIAQSFIDEERKGMDEHARALREFEEKVELIFLGNIEMADVQQAADAGHMSFEDYRLMFSANTGIPLSMLSEKPQDPFRLEVAEKEANIEATAKAKAKAKAAGPASGSSARK